MQRESNIQRDGYESEVHDLRLLSINEIYYLIEVEDSGSLIGNRQRNKEEEMYGSIKSEVMHMHKH